MKRISWYRAIGKFPAHKIGEYSNENSSASIGPKDAKVFPAILLGSYTDNIQTMVY